MILAVCQAEHGACDSCAQAAPARCQCRSTGSHLPGSALDPFWALRLTRVFRPQTRLSACLIRPQAS